MLPIAHFYFVAECTLKDETNCTIQKTVWGHVFSLDTMESVTSGLWKPFSNVMPEAFRSLACGGGPLSLEFQCNLSYFPFWLLKFAVRTVWIGNVMFWSKLFPPDSPHFPPIKDEKNQMMTTNVWLKQVSEGGRSVVILGDYLAPPGGWQLYCLLPNLFKDLAPTP